MTPSDAAVAVGVVIGFVAGAACFWGLWQRQCRRAAKWRRETENSWALADYWMQMCDRHRQKVWSSAMSPPEAPLAIPMGEAPVPGSVMREARNVLRCPACDFLTPFTVGPSSNEKTCVHCGQVFEVRLTVPQGCVDNTTLRGYPGVQIGFGPEGLDLSPEDPQVVQRDEAVRADWPEARGGMEAGL